MPLHDPLAISSSFRLQNSNQAGLKKELGVKPKCDITHAILNSFVIFVINFGQNIRGALSKSCFKITVL